jgi:hypothetical protein
MGSFFENVQCFGIVKLFYKYRKRRSFVKLLRKDRGVV